jgi:uncharacterized membrane protein
MPSWHVVAVALALAGYALLSHALMIVAADRPWAVAALLGPLVLAVSTLAWRQRHVGALLVCAALFVWLASVAASGEAQSITRLYLLQHAGIHLALCCTFAFTLRRGVTPLITALAERVHTTFTPAMRDYTRRLTGVWAGYFALMVVVSLALYAWAPWWWWSLFANLITPVSAVALFVGEHWLRYRWHPEFERASLAQALKAYRSTALVEARRP